METLLLTTALTGLASCIALTWLAWRTHHMQIRDAARVQRLHALAFPGGAPLDRGGPDASFHIDEFEGDEFRREQPLHAGALFVEPERSGASSRLVIAIVAVGLVMAVLVGAYRWIAEAPVTAPSTPPVSATTTSKPGLS
jgi:uncharacterized iron-regulated membrane protein